MIVGQGCTGASVAEPVEPAKARDALRATLDAWKSGSQADDLKSHPMAIVARDMDWQAGWKLLDYELQGEGKAVDANLLCRVTLELADPQGARKKEDVQYVVGTSPVVTVFREMSP
jgi:hypothetical protein